MRRSLGRGRRPELEGFPGFVVAVEPLLNR